MVIKYLVMDDNHIILSQEAQLVFYRMVVFHIFQYHLHRSYNQEDAGLMSLF